MAIKVSLPPLSVPMHRRRQTLAVLLTILLIPLCCSLFLLLLYVDALRPYAICYFIWTIIDRGPDYAHPRCIPFLRRLVIWTWMRDYFPVDLVKEADISPTRNYVFGYHPHGIIGIGAWVNFATEATGFSKLFPGINLRLLTLNSNFRVPVFREIIQWLNIASCSRLSCERILTREGPAGQAVALVVGGAEESLHTRPGHVQLVLHKRLGFIKLALRTGASLVPVLGLGETDVYEVVRAQAGTRLHRLQQTLKTVLGFTMPVFYGRGVFNYSMGLLPRRRRIVVVVGEAIDPAVVVGASAAARVRAKDASDIEIEELARHVQRVYVERLEEMWRRHARDGEDQEFRILE